MITAKQETVDVPVITKQEVVTLTISPEMAQFLFDITGKISGDPQKSRRGLADELRQGLRDLLCISNDYKDKYGNKVHGAHDIDHGMSFINLK